MLKKQAPSQNPFKSRLSSTKKGDDDEKRRRIYLIGLIAGVIVVLIAGIWLTYKQVVKSRTKADQIAKEEQHQEESLTPPSAAEITDSKKKANESPSDGVFVKSAPAVSDTSYHTERSGPVIHYKPHAAIEVARNAHFQPLYITGRTDKEGRFRITAPPAGDVYWREKGSAQAHTIRVTAAPKTQLKFVSSPKLTIDDSVRWTAQANASVYRLEFSKNEHFHGTVKMISTKKKDIEARTLGTGKYFIRVSALNTENGHWEMSPIEKIDIKGNGLSE